MAANKVMGVPLHFEKGVWLADFYSSFGMMVNLIRANALDESFQTRLHPAVQRDYIECLEEMRREDECEKRQDQAVGDGE